MNQIEKSRLSEILTLHDELKGLFKVGIQKAMRIGELLVKQKEEVGHGNWESWMEENLPFNERTAQRYMEYHRFRDLLENDFVSVLDFKSAGTLIHRQKYFDEMAVKCKLSPEKCQELSPIVLKIEHEDCYDIDDAIITVTASRETPKKKQLTDFESMLQSRAAIDTTMISDSLDMIQSEVESFTKDLGLDWSDRQLVKEEGEEVRKSISSLLQLLEKLVIKYWNTAEGTQL